MPRRFPAQRSFFAGWLARTLPFLRDRMLADPRFLFIVCAEVGIDSGAVQTCASPDSCNTRPCFLQCSSRATHSNCMCLPPVTFVTSAFIVGARLSGGD